jgi:hypothetical protein
LFNIIKFKSSALSNFFFSYKSHFHHISLRKFHMSVQNFHMLGRFSCMPIQKIHTQGFSIQNDLPLQTTKERPYETYCVVHQTKNNRTRYCIWLIISIRISFYNPCDFRCIKHVRYKNYFKDNDNARRKYTILCDMFFLTTSNFIIVFVNFKNVS